MHLTLPVLTLCLLGAGLTIGAGNAHGRTVCAITGEGVDVPDACQSPDAERLDLRRKTSIPISVALGGEPALVELHLVDETGARLHRISAAAHDPSATRVEYAPVETRHEFTRLSGMEAGNYQPAWHPKGRYLIWRQDDDPPRLWCADFQRRDGQPTAIDLPGAATKSLFGSDREGISTFRWHPDRVEVWIRLTRSSTLHRVKLDRCRPQITEASDLPPVDDFSIAPSGQLLSVRSAGTEQLRIVTLGGEDRGTLCGPEAALTELKTAICRGVRWHPDGRQLVFWRSLPGVAGSQRIVVAEIANGRLGRVGTITPDRAPQPKKRRLAKPALGARYAPDGRHLAFISDGALFVASTADVFVERPAARALSTAQGDYNGSHSSPVWLGPHHLAAVIEAIGNRHPVFVARLTPPGRTPSLLSAAFPDHHDLAYDPHSGRLALSAFDGQQGIFVQRLVTRRPTDAAPIEHTVRIESPGRKPDTLNVRSARIQLEPRMMVEVEWSAAPEIQRLDLVVTLEAEPTR